MRRLHEQLQFPLIYLADLDAIQGQASQLALVGQIADTFPDLQIWLDGGFRTPSSLAAATDERILPVVGSETWTDAVSPIGDKALLSIDRGVDGLRDPSGIAHDAARRPVDLILMNLVRVGADSGPDLAMLEHWRAEAPSARLYLAGVVRNVADLETIARAGAAGTLVASALHDGRLDARIIARLR